MSSDNLLLAFPSQPKRDFDALFEPCSGKTPCRGLRASLSHYRKYPSLNVTQITLREAIKWEFQPDTTTERQLTDHGAGSAQYQSRKAGDDYCFGMFFWNPPALSATGILEFLGFIIGALRNFFDFGYY